LRYHFIREQQKDYPLSLLCQVMQVSRSGYYKTVRSKPSQKYQLETKLIVEVKALAKESQNSYGSRMMAKHLQAKDYQVGRYAARTLMRKAGVECKQRRRYCVTTQSQHHLALAENILNWEFSVNEPDRAWVADMTYLWTLEGWLYIAAVLDLFSRRVVGWSMAEHMRETLVNEALQMALCRRQPTQGLLHHSDRGVEYVSHPY
jgi:putative transposase